MGKEEITVGSRTIEVANLDDAIFPDEGITQGDLIDVHRRLSDTMLPHLEGRPLAMQRFPNSIQDQGFYQRGAPDYFPDWIARVSVEVDEDDGAQPEVICDSEATLVYLVAQGLVTPHVWLSRADKLRHPDKLIFELDPPDSDFAPVRMAAEALHDLLGDLGLVPFVMTTGSRWDELSDPDLDSQSYTVKNIFRRLGQKEDPWKSYMRHARSLDEPRHRLDEVMANAGHD